ESEHHLEHQIKQLETIPASSDGSAQYTHGKFSASNRRRAIHSCGMAKLSTTYPHSLHQSNTSTSEPVQPEGFSHVCVSKEPEDRKTYTSHPPTCKGAKKEVR